MSKIKIALAALILAATTSSAVFAQTHHDANSSATRQHRNVRVQSAPVLQQRNVALPTADTSAGPYWYGSSGPTSGGM